ncbi:hypothetical protein MPUL_00590 [Mycolicibacterium pulveris]|uniref:Uncharacterized protein n=1 Tax=Mycolicibacterium pulveris TaxID=36813 RepID=A0A7I7UDB0_MYCPV|nr:hypothetical protein [Mycolicibacterium pulveris]BBY78901.1 hypothetical protein MPUL_00590 [Mycolicibacterium pulveris]
MTVSTLDLTPHKAGCTRCCDNDTIRDDNTSRAQRDRHEHGVALGVVTGTQRVTDCPHDYRRGMCWYCGDDEPRKDRNA